MLIAAGALETAVNPVPTLGDISGDFREVMWFQGLTAFLQPAKVVACCNRTAS